jgi:hypothetical protein
VRTILVALPLLLVACATRSEMRNLPSDAGTKAVYKADFDLVRTACTDSAAELGFTVQPKETVATTAEVRFLATQGLASGTGGRFLRARIVREPVGTVVFVVVRSKVDTADARVTDELLEKEFQQRVAGRLGKK